MNKSTVIIAALALLAASCTKTEVVSCDAQGSQRGIGFSAYTAKPTKAAQEDVMTEDFNSFQVTAIGNGAVYFDNVTFTKNGEGVWASTPVYFWPAYALNFYAYNKPVNGEFTPTFNTTSQTLTFTPSTTLTEQEDLVAAYAPNETQPVSGATALKFNHYLTQIVVKALNTNSTYKVEVAGVKIAHMQNKVKYTFSSSSESTEVATDAGDETYLSEFERNAKTLDGTAQEVMTSANTGNKWYLVPQTVNAWDRENNMTNKGASSSLTTTYDDGTYLALKVKITANNGKLKIYPASASEEYAWMAVPVPASQEFKQGHKYTFVINFFQKNGAGFVDPEEPSDIDGDHNADNDKGKPIIGGPIQFSANVNTWPDETVITIDL